MEFLKGIKIDTFLSTYDEWHAFVNGFCEVLCPWPPRCHCDPERSEGEAISAEYHYYMFGRALAVIAWLIIAVIIKEAFF
jgi:hypothetical protein